MSDKYENVLPWKDDKDFPSKKKRNDMYPSPYPQRYADQYESMNDPLNIPALSEWSSVSKEANASKVPSEGVNKEFLGNESVDWERLRKLINSLPTGSEEQKQAEDYMRILEQEDQAYGNYPKIRNSITDFLNKAGI